MQGRLQPESPAAFLSVSSIRTLLERVENFRLDLDKPPPEAKPGFVLSNLAHPHIRFDWL